MEFCWDYTSQIGNANLCVMYTVSTLNIYILPEQKIYVFGHTWFHVTHYELSKYLGQVMLHVRVWDYIPQWECKPCVIMFSICSSFSNWFWAECSNFYNFCWKCSTILLKTHYESQHLSLICWGLKFQESQMMLCYNPLL